MVRNRLGKMLTRALSVERGKKSRQPQASDARRTKPSGWGTAGTGAAESPHGHSAEEARQGRGACLLRRREDQSPGLHRILLRTSRFSSGSPEAVSCSPAARGLLYALTTPAGSAAHNATPFRSPQTCSRSLPRLRKRHTIHLAAQAAFYYGYIQTLTKIKGRVPSTQLWGDRHLATTFYLLHATPRIKGDDS